MFNIDLILLIGNKCFKEVEIGAHIKNLTDSKFNIN